MMKAMLFDLDGVIVSTDDLHFKAWKKIAEEEKIEFTEQDNHRLRGVSRMDSLEILLEKASKDYSEEEKLLMAEKKNEDYRISLFSLDESHILPGVMDLLDLLKSQGIQVAIGSSSKNAVPILRNIGLYERFEVIIDGTKISRSKPHPEVFSKGAEALGLKPEDCIVVEDALSGVQAGKAAGMKVIAINLMTDGLADLEVKDLTEVRLDKIEEFMIL